MFLRSAECATRYWRRRERAADQPSSPALWRAAEQAWQLINWLPARTTALGFAIVGSFEDAIEVEGIVDGNIRAVFIRAPWVETTGPGVEVLSEVRDHPVAVTEGNVTALSFHPELTPDNRIHEWFVGVCSG